jgi:hypothetical protein
VPRELGADAVALPARRHRPDRYAGRHTIRARTATRSAVLT